MPLKTKLPRGNKRGSVQKLSMEYKNRGDGINVFKNINCPLGDRFSPSQLLFAATRKGKEMRKRQENRILVFLFVSHSTQHFFPRHKFSLLGM